MHRKYTKYGNVDSKRIWDWILVLTVKKEQHHCHPSISYNLETRRFCNKWFNWINQVVPGGCSLCQNQQHLCSHKGVRQGDSLSPVLFNFVADCLERWWEGLQYRSSQADNISALSSKSSNAIIFSLKENLLHKQNVTSSPIIYYYWGDLVYLFFSSIDAQFFKPTNTSTKWLRLDSSCALQNLFILPY